MTYTEKDSEEDLLARYREGLEKERLEALENHAPLIETFMEFASGNNIQLEKSDFDYIPTTGIVVKSPGIARRLMCGIPAERDELLPFKSLLRQFSLDGCQEGYLNCGTFMAMAHPYFRRGLHEINNFAPRFIEKFWEISDESIDSFIALDDDRLRINVDGRCYLEADTWYGARFCDDISLIPLGLTKLRPPMDLTHWQIEFFFASAYALDVKWTQEGRIKTFQALEFKTERVTLERQQAMVYPARYVHAEFDLDIGVFRHFDGAVQHFTENEYLARRDSDFNYNYKNSQQIKASSRKLFKFNGHIETMMFIDLCCHFFAANPLAIEYFEGKYPSGLAENIERMRALNNTRGATVG